MHREIYFKRKKKGKGDSAKPNNFSGFVLSWLTKHRLSSLSFKVSLIKNLN